MTDRLKKWIFSLQGKFILVASVCLLVFTIAGSFLILSREKDLYMQDIVNQGKVLAEISRLTITNVMVYNDLGIMDEQDIFDYLDYFIMNLMERDKRVRYVFIVDNKNMALAQSNVSKQDTVIDESITDVFTDFKTRITETGFQNEQILKITAPLNIETKNWGALQIGLSIKDVHSAVDSLKREILAISAISSIIALMIISIGAKVLAKPVIQLTGKMDSIKTYGDFNPQTFELNDRRDEIGELQKSCLWMLHRLKEADKEHKKTLEVLAQTEKMVSIGRLASGVAHEINNPLGAITLCFKNLIESDIRDFKKEELIIAIDDGLQKIKGITGQLLDFSRITVTEKKPVDVNDLINHLLVLLNYSASRKNIKIVSDLSGDIPKILMDENKMTQVFLNIMLNALQAMDRGGVLTIKTKRDNGFCEVFVNDTGTGISPDVLPNVFDPFFTTKGIGEGTGLGLSVSKGIVDQHGGTIEISSEVDAGTTFKVKLPIEA
ncbi:MAG: hypothetical protein HY756_02890 [Nitrospirae bacterium]|nr:hypothetical protein [Nitrospirota bacterium]